MQVNWAALQLELSKVYRYMDTHTHTHKYILNIIFFFLIGQILTFLKKKKPEDAFCVVGITMIDLYPRDSWNFVFGQASLTEGIPF